MSNATTITSGVDLPGGDVNADKEIIDVVDPIFVKLTSTIDAPAQTTTIKIRGTDKYYTSST